MTRNVLAVTTLFPSTYLLASLVMSAFCLEFGCLNFALCQERYDDAKTAEGWSWPQIKQGNVLDFNEHCGTDPALDPQKVEDAKWKDDCRKLSSRFLMKVLTESKWEAMISRRWTSD